MTEVKSYCYNLVMIVPFMKTQVVNDLINSLLESNRRYSILLVLVDMSLEKDGLIEGSGLLTIKKISLNNKVSSSRSRNIGIEYIVNHLILLFLIYMKVLF